MHPAKRWTHANTRPMRQNLKPPKYEMGTLGGLGQDHFKMTHLIRNPNHTLSSIWRRAPSARALYRHLHHALLAGRVSCHDPVSLRVARNVVALDFHGFFFDAGGWSARAFG